MDRSYFLERIAENLRVSKVAALLGRASLERRLWRENSAEPMPVVKTRNSAVLLRIWSFFGLLIARLPSFRGVEIFSSARDEAHSEFNFPVSSFQSQVSSFPASSRLLLGRDGGIPLGPIGLGFGIQSEGITII